MSKSSNADTEQKGGRETCHPHSTCEYNQWMSSVWKMNAECNKV